MKKPGILEALRRSFEQPTNGIVGIVDDFLKLCRQSGLKLEWREEGCIASLPGKEETLELLLRKSVLRAILARVATLCSEKAPDTFAPYGGKGELCLGSENVLQAAWANTTQEQWLMLAPVRIENGNAISACSLPNEVSTNNETTTTPVPTPDPFS